MDRFRVTSNREEAAREAKTFKDIMCTAIEEKDTFNNLLKKHDYWKFIYNMAQTIYYFL